MLIITNNGYYQKPVFGSGGSIFTPLSNFFRNLAMGDIASTALNLGKSTAKDMGSKVLSFGKTAAKELGKQAVKTGVDTGKKYIKRGVEKGVTKLLTPRSQETINRLTGIPMEKSSPDNVAKNTNALLTTFLDKGAEKATQSLSSLIDGAGQLQQQQNAVHIQDLVRRLNAHRRV